MTTAQKPDALPVVAWRKHLSGAEWKVADYVLPDSEPLVRLSDAQAALQALAAEKDAEIAALKLQLETGPLYSTRKKAKRYDWLRNEAHPDREDTGLSVSERDFNDWGKSFNRYFSGDALDAAIDSALALAAKEAK